MHMHVSAKHQLVMYAAMYAVVQAWLKAPLVEPSAMHHADMHSCNAQPCLHKLVLL
jgi:hypothetical protein